MYRISNENSQFLSTVRNSSAAYAALRESRSLPMGDDLCNGLMAGVAVSPLQAMEMGGCDIQSELPITVTITLTTIFYPGPAH